MGRLLFLLLFLPFDASSQINELKDIIRDPVVSRRCKALLREREAKIKVQQRLNSLITRNKNLQRKLKKSQKITRRRLELNAVQLNNNFRLTQMRVKSMEEDIIRKGCPGITI